jgi:NADH-quinone oxidoreductase subunit N
LSLLAWSPELFLTTAALALLVFDLLVPAKKGYVRHLALASLAVTMVLSLVVAFYAKDLYGLHFSGALKLDTLTTYGRLLFMFVGMLVVLASWDFYGKESLAEYYGLFMLSLIGEVVIISGQSLLMLFIGIELLAIPTYALTAILKRQETAVEAGLKYFLLGMFASVVMLYGIALVYGSLGTVSYLEPLFVDPATLLTGKRDLLLFGFFLLMMGVGFKIAAFPFHFWSPDVYAGGSTPVVAYISTIPKVAIVLALFRILGPQFTQLYPVGRWYIAALCLLSMTYGNVVALLQDDMRRLLAYSGIANTGYALIAIVAGGKNAQEALLFFLVLYTFTTIGAFFVVLGVSGQERCTVADFLSLGRRSPFLAGSMAVLMFSLAGTPPLAGFFGKLALFKSAVDAGFWWLALAGLLNSVVSVAYYLRVAQQMYGGASEQALELPGEAPAALPVTKPLRASIALTVAATLVLGVAGIGVVSSLL